VVAQPLWCLGDGLDDRGWILYRGGDFFSPLGPEAYQASYPMGIGGFFLGIKRPGSVAYQ